MSGEARISRIRMELESRVCEKCKIRRACHELDEYCQAFEILLLTSSLGEPAVLAFPEGSVRKIVSVEELAK